MTAKEEEEGNIKRALMKRAEKEKHDSWQTGKAVLLCSAQSHCTLAGQMG